MHSASLSKPVLPEDWQSAGFGVYIHWPFCQAKCPYCDFNSHVAGRIDQIAWADAYEQEIARTAAELPGRVVDSVFFGGGTPSLMEPETVSRVLDAVRKAWSVANDFEVTLEANPTSVEADRFAGYRATGVNRVSLGIQSLNDDHLRRLGRLHTAKEALAALDVAQATFDRVSFDLMYGLQDQSVSEWQADLERAVGFGTTHLSLYQLTIEEGTAFGARHAAGKLSGLPDELLSERFYKATIATCDAAGFKQYEISNFAKEDAVSRHNLIYWRYGDYVGVGPGAHGRITVGGQKQASYATASPAAWLKKVEDYGSGEEPRVDISRSEQAHEYLMMGLRLTEGIDIDRCQALAGRPLPESEISSLGGMNLLERSNGRLRATDKGRLLLNPIIERLLPDS